MAPPPQRPFALVEMGEAEYATLCGYIRPRPLLPKQHLSNRTKSAAGSASSIPVPALLYARPSGRGAHHLFRRRGLVGETWAASTAARSLTTCRPWRPPTAAVRTGNLPGALRLCPPEGSTGSRPSRPTAPSPIATSIPGLSAEEIIPCSWPGNPVTVPTRAPALHRLLSGHQAAIAEPHPQETLPGGSRFLNLGE